MPRQVKIPERPEPGHAKRKSEQVPDQRYIPDVSEKIFTHDISMIRRQKMVILGVLKVFISNFTYYNLY